MSRQNIHSSHDRPKRHYSPQYGQAPNRTDSEISQAETSVDYRRRNRRYDDDRHRRSDSKHDKSKDSRL